MTEMAKMTEHPIKVGGACFFIWKKNGRPVLRSELFDAEYASRAAQGNWALWLSLRHLPQVKGSYCSWAAASWPLPDGLPEVKDDGGDAGRYLPGSWIYATSAANRMLTRPDNRAALQRLGVDPAAVWMEETGGSREDFDKHIESFAEYCSDWIAGGVL